MTNRRKLWWMMGSQGEKYLLRDDFSDTLAAGSVNGTLAVPGPGTRAVVDTTDKLSLGSGIATLLGNALGDPNILFSAAITRTAGRMFIAEAKMAVATSDKILGFGVDFSYPASSSVYFESAIRIFDSGISVIVGAYSANISYKVAIVLRAAGAFALIKGGAFNNWSLLSVLSVNNTATLYAGLATNLQSITSMFMRVPVTLWLPTPLASDGMSSATATDGLGHAETTGIGAGGANVPWAAAATWSVAGGVCLNTPTLGAEQATGALVVGTWYQITATEVNHFYTGCAVEDVFCATATTGLDANNKVKALTTAELFRAMTTALTADVVAQVKQIAQDAGTPSGIGIRLNSSTTPTTGIIARFDGLGNISVVEFSGATYTQLFTAAKAYTAGDSLQLIADGANVMLIHLTSAGVATLIGSTAVATITTCGYHGLFSTDPGNTLDNFTVYARGTGNEYSILDRWSK